MNYTKLRRAGLALVVVGVVATGGFFLGRMLVDGGGTEANEPSVADRLDGLGDAKDAEELEPRFVGELLGIHLAPSIDGIPREVLDEDERLTVGGCSRIEPGDAGDLSFSRPLTMPVGFALAEPEEEGRNPWASACSGATRILGQRYAAVGAEEIPAAVTIVRTRLRYDTQDIAESRVSTQVIGGRAALVISALESSGLAQRSLVYFPESFGMTVVHAFNLSESDLFEVALAVAEATR